MPINSFWTADDKIPIAQKKVSVPSDNGLEYSAGQKINITIPPTVQYIQPRESYLSWDVKVQLPENASAGSSTAASRTTLRSTPSIGSPCRPTP